MVSLAEHRPHPAHLPHQPLDDLVVFRGARGQEAAVLLGEVHENRARFDDGIGPAPRALGIHDRGDLLVGVDRGVGVAELVAGPDVDLVQGVGDAELLDHHRDLAPVRGLPGIDVEHALPPFRRAGTATRPTASARPYTRPTRPPIAVPPAFSALVVSVETSVHGQLKLSSGSDLLRGNGIPCQHRDSPEKLPMPTRNIVLTEHQSAIIASLESSGRYQNAGGSEA